MKVIAVDNYGREYYSDKLIQDNLSEEDAQQLANKKNEEADSHGDWYYRAVKDDHTLWEFQP